MPTKRPTIKVPLSLPNLAPEGLDVQRSGIRWLRPDGYRCRPGEVIAWCNLGLLQRPGFSGPVPFQDGTADLQVALAPRQGGRLRKARGASRGGWLNFHCHARWSPGTVLGHLECAPEDVVEGGKDHETLRTLFLAGRPVTDLAEVRWGPLTGWHERSRGWWAEGEGDIGTVLSLGICEQLGIIRGEQGAFLELFEQVPGPAHVVFVPDIPLVPATPVLCSQLQRSPAERDRIAEDLARTLGNILAGQGKAGPAVAQDWIFAGALLKAVLGCPLLEPYDLFTARAARRLGPANAVVLSLHSEQAVCLRHKRLGYVVSFHAFRLQRAGPAIVQWLRSEFEVIRRTPDELRRDYRTLIDLVRGQTRCEFLILNCVSSTGLDDVYCYTPFRRPLRDELTNIRAKELNLMLYQLARERDISLVDVDALAAELGTGKHIPDGIHQSGPLQEAVRAQILTILRERGVPGFDGRAAALR